MYPSMPVDKKGVSPNTGRLDPSIPLNKQDTSLYLSRQGGYIPEDKEALPPILPDREERDLPLSR